jgi:hypothetical protein
MPMTRFRRLGAVGDPPPGGTLRAHRAPAPAPGRQRPSRMLLEQPVAAAASTTSTATCSRASCGPLGVVESVMYPGTQAFMRFVYPCALPDAAPGRAHRRGARFPRRGRLRPRPVQHGVLPRRGQRPAHGDRIQPAHGGAVFRPLPARRWRRPASRGAGTGPRPRPRAPAARRAHGRGGGQLRLSQLRSRRASAHARPSLARRRELARQFPDALLFRFPKTPGQIARDFKWLGSYRYGILHLGGRDAGDLAARCAAASEPAGLAAPACGTPDQKAATKPVPD